MAIINKTIREFVDLDMSFAIHPITKNVSVKKNTNAVKQSVLNLLRIKSGEKPFHPEIKSPIYDFLFENSSPVLKIVIEDEVKKYLEFYEPRVEITNVNVTFPNVNGISCDVEGRILNVSEPFTVNVFVDRVR